MNSKHTKNRQGADKSFGSLLAACASLTLILGSVSPAFAQNFDATTEDSLLPPEVVPLDSAAASRMVEAQSQSRAASLGSQDMSGSVPGLSGSSQNPSSLSPALSPSLANLAAQGQQARDMRQGVINSLLSQPELAPQMNANMAQMATGNPMMQPQPQQQQGGPSQFASQGTLTNANDPSNNQLGQSQWMNPQQLQGGAAQSQMLSAGGYQPTMQMKQGKKAFSGLRHTASMASSFGAGALAGAFLSGRPRGYFNMMGAMGLSIAGTRLLSGMRF